jgi:RHS repeat-associated protein
MPVSTINALTNTTSLNNMQPRFDRGYTGHEMVCGFGLINMNGRLYDPYLQRFLSPDPYVQSPLNAQNYNRYSYCLNNPLMYVDPSGYNFLIGAFDFISGLSRIVWNVATLPVAIVCLPFQLVCGTSYKNTLFYHKYRQIEYGWDTMTWGLFGDHKHLTSPGGVASGGSSINNNSGTSINSNNNENTVNGGSNSNQSSSTFNWSSSSSDVFFKSNVPTSMNPQLGNTCVTSIMSYTNKLFGGDKSVNDFNDDYKMSYHGRDAKTGGVLTSDVASFTSDEFNTTEFKGFINAINNFNPVMTDIPSSGKTSHNVLIVGYNSSNNDLIYMDPLTANLMETSDDLIFDCNYSVQLTGNK